MDFLSDVGMVMDIKKMRNDLTLQGEHSPAYLDNACVTLKPKVC